MKLKLLMPILLVAVLVSGCIQEEVSSETGETTPEASETTAPETSEETVETEIIDLGGSCQIDKGCYYIECTDGSGKRYCLNNVQLSTERICVEEGSAALRQFDSVSGDPRCSCINNVCVSQ